MSNEKELKLGFKIKFERKKRNLSQEKLAEMTGLSTVTIRKVEAGIGNITVKNLCKIAEALELDLGILTDFKF